MNTKKQRQKDRIKYAIIFFLASIILIFNGLAFQEYAIKNTDINAVMVTIASASLGLFSFVLSMNFLRDYLLTKYK